MEVNEQILNLVLAHMEAYDIPAYDETTGKGLVRHVLIRYGFQSKEIMVCLVVNGSRIPGAEDLIAKLREIPGMTSISLNINREKTNVILGRKGKLLWGQEYITDRTDRLSDLPAVFLPGQSGADTETLRKSTGIRRSGRK